VARPDGRLSVDVQGLAQIATLCGGLNEPGVSYNAALGTARVLGHEIWHGFMGPKHVDQTLAQAGVDDATGESLTAAMLTEGGNQQFKFTEEQLSSLKGACETRRRRRFGGGGQRGNSSGPDMGTWVLIDSTGCSGSECGSVVLGWLWVPGPRPPHRR
jgi:hypothetical protein